MLTMVPVWFCGQTLAWLRVLRPEVPERRPPGEASAFRSMKVPQTCHRTRTEPSSAVSRSPVFYSPILRAVREAERPLAAAHDWLIDLLQYPRVTREELDWMCVPRWLSLQDGPVLRLDLLGYVRENVIELHERVISRTGTETRGDLVEGHEDGTARQSAMRTDWPRHEEDTEPGGTNYRELLLLIPDLHVTGANRRSLTREEQQRWDYAILSSCGGCRRNALRPVHF